MAGAGCLWLVMAAITTQKGLSTEGQPILYQVGRRITPPS